MARRPVAEDVVRLIYDVAEAKAGAGLDGWHGLLTTTAQYLGADKGHIFLVDPSERMVETRFDGLAESSIEDYHRHFQFIDPRFVHARTRNDQVFSDALVLDQRSFKQTEIYNDFLARTGIRHSLFVNIEFAPGRVAPQAYFRPPELGPFEREDVTRLQLLVPHIARALRFRQLLSEARAEAADLQATLDALAISALLLGSLGEIHCASRRALELLEALPELTTRQGRLKGATALVAGKLEAAFAAMRHFIGGGAGESAEHTVPPAIELRQTTGRPVTLLFLPLPPRHQLRAAHESRARILVAFHDPESVRRLDPQPLMSLFQLTPTEAALAVALAEGQSLLQFALERGSAEQTARVHLKRVMEKTRTCRQADLVRLLLTSCVTPRSDV